MRDDGVHWTRRTYHVAIVLQGRALPNNEGVRQLVEDQMAGELDEDTDLVCTHVAMVPPTSNLLPRALVDPHSGMDSHGLV
jgi:hypothetical protein